MPNFSFEDVGDNIKKVLTGKNKWLYIGGGVVVVGLFIFIATRRGTATTTDTPVKDASQLEYSGYPDQSFGSGEGSGVDYDTLSNLLSGFDTRLGLVQDSYSDQLDKMQDAYDKRLDQMFDQIGRQQDQFGDAYDDRFAAMMQSLADNQAATKLAIEQAMLSKVNSPAASPDFGTPTSSNAPVGGSAPKGAFTTGSPSTNNVQTWYDNGQQVINTTTTDQRIINAAGGNNAQAQQMIQKTDQIANQVNQAISNGFTIGGQPNPTKAPPANQPVVKGTVVKVEKGGR